MKQTALKTKNDPRWRFVVARDARADGQFYYSVATTGVYCRPSCAARLARPENVHFHDSREAAEQAGFRPCKRCRPDQPSLHEQHLQTITSICKLIENSARQPSLSELAKQAGFSTYHLHRVFKAITGLTPKAYATAYRASQLRSELERGNTVTDAIYNAGYHASSRFYEKSKEVLGMKPTDYRSRGANIDIRFAIGECTLGAILVACSSRGVCAVFIGDDPELLLRELQDTFAQANLIGSDREFEKLVAKVIGFVEAPAIGIDLPLDIRGTVFQQRVWNALMKIPVGDTVCYSDIAKIIGSPKSVRAVASACAANCIAVAIPCHRVIKKDGNLSGYRWGVERKKKLLEHESASKKSGKKSHRAN